ncbi:recombinase family protein [Vescimonas coprocola]|uniref:recombinase family protein n=1 Tax=Vescimonas coprocola TaxID=2714355 RepID=UPI001BD115C4|nr:recombinase family protein [Vescimonas coprocola]
MSSQKLLLEKYAAEKGFTNTLFLYDDGYSGTNFNRPGWQQVMELMENGQVETLIVKDYCAIIGLNQKDLENQGILA